MTAPSVSIVIPHFERVTLLRETLQSIESQSCASWEVHIVDDGSSATTWAAVQSLTDGKRIHATQRQGRAKGPSSCRNIGAEHAQADWLMFIDSDDLMAPWCLEQRLKIATDDKDFHVFPIGLFKECMGDQADLWNALHADRSDIHRFLSSDPPWQTSSPLWRRQAFLDLGGFNEKIFYGDDSDLHTRALLANLSYAKHAEALLDVFIRRSDEPRITNNASAKMVQQRRNRLTEGAKELRDRPREDTMRILWEGQFFQEAEFFLFNLPKPDQAVRDTIDLMQRHALPPMNRLRLVRSYFSLALSCKAKAYFLVRLARRLAMLALPKEYFPTPASNQRQMDEATLQTIRARLADSPTAG